MRILMTGATGVVGRRAAPMLVRAGHDVTAVGRNPARRAALERAGATVIALDLFDRAAVRAAVAGHDIVINLATHIPRSTVRMMLPGAFRENDRIRRDGSAILAAAATDAGVSRFIQESFAPSYADGGDRWLDETAPLRPVRYNRTVLDAEHSAERFGRGSGSAVVLRFAGFYGPDAFQLHDMVKLVRRGWAPLPGAPSAYSSWVSHDDAASAVITALAAPEGIYNVCDDEPLTRRAFSDALADALGVPHPRLLPAWTKWLMGSLGELMARSERMSNRKLRATGWAPRYPSVREGFREFLVRKWRASSPGTARLRA
ncbi:MAG TPA: NAD-dependent epimerase/dehydratase family protein [Gemmatimonadaceae bacterium]|nr:NAD-dependent epimerase/dehydratase family protein [Gemmatimonadaceae bacterium]